MKQLGIIFKFEFFTYVKRKSFWGLCIALVLIVAVMLSWPRISALFGESSSGESTTPKDVTTIAISNESATAKGVSSEDASSQMADYFNTTMGMMGYKFVPVAESQQNLQALVEDRTYDEALVVTAPLQYTRIARTVGMYDSFDKIFSNALTTHYQANALEEQNVSPDVANAILHAQVKSELVQTATGKDQMSSFIYTYVLIFALYFAIIMYGQFVASSVATEKSTRAMELLVTSAKPANLMFGKVFGAGLAGLSQLLVILGSGYLFYNLNAQYHTNNQIVQSIFGMPLNMLMYTFLFFVLGFFIYAFLFAALASLVSRMEDLSTTTMPITWVFIIAFMVVMFSMSSGNLDSALMIACSYIPLTSPMAMFARIAMSEVAAWEIILSVAILLGSTIATGMLASAIYRLGVLMYGNPPKPREIVRLLKASKRG